MYSMYYVCTVYLLCMYHGASQCVQCVCCMHTVELSVCTVCVVCTVEPVSMYCVCCVYCRASQYVLFVYCGYTFDVLTTTVVSYCSDVIYIPDISMYEHDLLVMCSCMTSDTPADNRSLSTCSNGN